VPSSRALRAISAGAASSYKKSSNKADPSRWILGGLVMLAAGGLVLFHLALLAGRFADASIAHPEVIAQWIGAALLGVGAAALRRQGSSLVSGRSALVFWLLVLLLHVGFGTGIALTGEEIGSSRELLLLLPFAAFTLSAASRPSDRGGSSRSEVALHFAAGDLRFPLFDPCPAASSAGSGPDRFSPRPPPFS
jgi:hypothetical protein